MNKNLNTTMSWSTVEPDYWNVTGGLVLSSAKLYEESVPIFGVPVNNPNSIAKKVVKKNGVVRSKEIVTKRMFRFD